MRHDEDPLDPELERLVEDSRKSIVAPGSDSAVNREAPVVTGDSVMDTQLENLRRILCARVWSVYNMVLRAKSIRLWAIKRKEADHSFPPSLVKRDDHPSVQILVRQGQELAKIDAVDCGGDPKLELLQASTRLRALSDVQDTTKQIEKMGTEALAQAQDLIKSFHAMAQQYKIHRDKLVPPSQRPVSTLQQLAAIAFKKPDVPT